MKYSQQQVAKNKNETFMTRSCHKIRNWGIGERLVKLVIASYGY